MTCPKMMTNDPSLVVDDCVEGFVSASNSRLVRLHDHENVVLRADVMSLKDKVAIISGGGSGHEPAHAGYVGPGMLTGAACGALFTSPPVGDIYSAALAIFCDMNPSGILFIAKNYTGDRIVFGLALEKTRSSVNVPCDLIIVNDDRSTEESRRGIAGTVLIHKIAGAMAEEGKSLDEITHMIRSRIIPNIGTIGVSLSPVYLPGRSFSSFVLPNDEMELGLGIHGEAGVKRVKLQPAVTTVDSMISFLSAEDCMNLKEKESIILLINNLGGSSVLEIGIIVKEAVKLLKDKHIQIERVYSGTFMSSVQMAGFSITILKLGVTPSIHIKSSKISQILQYLDAPSLCIGWNGASANIPPSSAMVKSIKAPEYDETSLKIGPELKSAFAKQVILTAVNFSCEALVSCEQQLNTMDSDGDGDCGSTLRRGADKLLSLLSNKKELMVDYPASLMKIISIVAEEKMGGTSGAMYGIFFSTASNSLKDAPEITFNVWKDAISKSLDAVMVYGGAKPGYRTLIDALHPYLLVLTKPSDKNYLELLDDATKAAEEGAKNTLYMKAKAGRVQHVPQLSHPDPGAHAVTIILRAINEAVKLQSNRVIK